MEKLIITLAPTGNVPTKTMNQATPVTVEEIVEEIKRCRLDILNRIGWINF